jgi:hypothetical protein
MIALTMTAFRVCGTMGRCYRPERYGGVMKGAEILTRGQQRTPTRRKNTICPFLYKRVRALIAMLSAGLSCLASLRLWSRHMAGKDEKDREPWLPRLDSSRLFINSADYERSLGEGSNPPDTDILEDEPEDSGETVSPEVPDPNLKPES